MGPWVYRVFQGNTRVPTMQLPLDYRISPPMEVNRLNSNLWDDMNPELGVIDPILL